jgi:hypothetical protein
MLTSLLPRNQLQRRGAESDGLRDLRFFSWEEGWKEG